jgi:hypothetical protein
MRLVMTGMLLVTLLMTSGCASSFADPSGKHRTFKIAQRRYTEMVRWGQLERASAYVASEFKEKFLEDASQMLQIRVTDFEIGEPDFADDDNAVTITVVYHAFSLTTLIERQIFERQEWHREGGIKNQWRVQPDLQQIVSGTAGPTR